MNPETFAAISVISTVCVAVFWMVVGWRAMRAHEKIANALQAPLLRARQAARDKDADRNETDYAEFIESEPLSRHLESNERLRRFAAWKEQKYKNKESDTTE